MKRANKDDVIKVYELIRPYFEESSLMFRGTFSPENSISTIAGWLYDDDYHCYLTDHSFIAMVVKPIFTVENESMVEMFYVSPDMRATEESRKLLKKIDEVNKNHNVLNCYAISQSAFNDGGKNAKLFSNLFKKHGFYVIGDSLVKEY